MNAETAGHAGTPQLKQLNTDNIEMFRHPKYYKELRKRNKSDQVISLRAHDGECERAPGQGLKPQATSSQASSDKRQAPSNKRQASSRKRQAPWF